MCGICVYVWGTCVYVWGACVYVCCVCALNPVRNQGLTSHIMGPEYSSMLTLWVNSHRVCNCII